MDMDNEKWKKLLLNERPIGVDRLANILTDLVSRENITHDMNGNEEYYFTETTYKIRIVDIVLSLIRGINKNEIASNINGDFDTYDLQQLKSKLLISNSGYFDTALVEKVTQYADFCSQTFPEVVPLEAIRYFYEMLDTAAYLPPSLIEYLDNESNACQELPQPQSPQFKDIDLSKYPLICDVITMLEQGKSKEDIAEYLTTKKIYNATIGALLHDNPYGVSHDTLQKFATRLKNKNS